MPDTILETNMERVAECQCWQLKAIARGEPSSNYLCHCKACQRRSGSAIQWGMRWEKHQVRLEGQTKVYARKADSGFEIRYFFCPNCGSTIFAESDRTPEFCAVPAGCFADPGLPAPTISVWEGSMRSAHHVRRDKAALFQRVQAPPGDRSSRKQPEQAWRRRNV